VPVSEGQYERLLREIEGMTRVPVDSVIEKVKSEQRRLLFQRSHIANEPFNITVDKSIVNLVDAVNRLDEVEIRVRRCKIRAEYLKEKIKPDPTLPLLLFGAGTIIPVLGNLAGLAGGIYARYEEKKDQCKEFEQLVITTIPDYIKEFNDLKIFIVAADAEIAAEEKQRELEKSNAKQAAAAKAAADAAAKKREEDAETLRLQKLETEKQKINSRNQKTATDNTAKQMGNRLDEVELNRNADQRNKAEAAAAHATIVAGNKKTKVEMANLGKEEIASGLVPPSIVEKDVSEGFDELNGNDRSLLSGMHQAETKYSDECESRADASMAEAKRAQQVLNGVQRMDPSSISIGLSMRPELVKQPPSIPDYASFVRQSEEFHTLAYDKLKRKLISRREEFRPVDGMTDSPRAKTLIPEPVIAGEPTRMPPKTATTKPQSQKSAVLAPK
jgi:hypothetical protein